MEFKFYYDFDDEELKVASRSDVIAARIVFGSDKSCGRLATYLLEGGQISVSSTVSNTQLYNWARRTGFSIFNKFVKSGRMKNIIKKAMAKHTILVFGWSVINGVKGHYTSLKTNEENDDDTTILIMRNTPMEVIEDIATALCKAFKQESVEIVNFKNNIGYLWGGEIGRVTLPIFSSQFKPQSWIS